LGCITPHTGAASGGRRRGGERGRVEQPLHVLGHRDQVHAQAAQDRRALAFALVGVHGDGVQQRGAGGERHLRRAKRRLVGQGGQAGAQRQHRGLALRGGAGGAGFGHGGRTQHAKPQRQVGRPGGMRQQPAPGGEREVGGGRPEHRPAAMA
jgi:hypothetical protein